MLKRLVSACTYSASPIALVFCAVAVQAQEVKRDPPKWWFGGAAAANLNFYGGTTQTLNPALIAPAPFHEGFGTGLYLAPLVEYHHNARWGGIFQIGYDDRSGSFDDQICPCGEIETLSAKIRYLSIEPSVRYAPFSGDFHIFAGPRVAFNWAPNIPKSSTRDEGSFVYTREGQPTTRANFSDMRGTVFSGQVGMGYDVPLAAPNNRTQVELSPFISFQPFIGEGPRSVESWRLTTWRVGAAVKFGRGKIIPQAAPAPAAALPCIEPEHEVRFSVLAPRAVIAKRRIRETFPLRNYVFFEKGSATIPDRYVQLTKKQAADFKEEQLQEVETKNATGRSLRQMNVYYNILNTVGDRLKRNAGTTIVLGGASEKGSKHGKARAESIKQYLVSVFGIEASRIRTEGRDKPKLPSQQPGGAKDLDLLQAEDRRVDIESDSPELLTLVGGKSNSMKPVQIVALVEDPNGSPVVFEAAGSREAFTSWSLELTDEQGATRQFGPFTQERETIPGNTILGARSRGDYKAVLVGLTKDGKTRRKEGSFSLFRKVEPVRESVRFSILFDFDKSKTVAGYEKFLTTVVTPLIPDSATIVIHGHTDVIGEWGYNDTLSQERVQDTRNIIERALLDNPKREITFQTMGFGKNPDDAPFDNSLPEERFYNRTVTIDIVPD